MTAPQGQPRRRSRATRYALAGLLALPLLELVVAILVGRAIGAPATLLLLILLSLAGLVVLRRGGAEAIRSWSAQTARAASARAASGQGMSGVGTGPGPSGWLLLGGLLLVVPGFVSAAAGILLVFPFTRRLVAPLLGRGAGLLAARLVGAPLMGRVVGSRVVQGDVVDATVVDVQVVPPTRSSASPAAELPERDDGSERNGPDGPSTHQDGPHS